MIRLRFHIVFMLLALLQSTTAQVPLRTKIASMVMVGFTGTTVPESLKADLQLRGLGGVILYAANMTSAAQITSLTSQLRSFSATPLLLAVDQEGGKVARLGPLNGFSATPTAYHIGTQVNREDSTRTTAALMAGWMRQCGFNLDFAPVADVNVNPVSPAIGKLDRSYSALPESVARHTAWFADELRKKGILSTLKHFPGHGSATNDSHLGFTDITNTWTAPELLPYRSAITDGTADLIMTGHLFNARFDSLYPASLSNRTVSGLLRDSLHYSGVVVSDELFMNAISANYAFDDVLELCINSGTDILLFGKAIYNTRSLTGYVVDVVASKVQQGRIAVSRIDSAYNRLQRLKQRLTLLAVTDAVPPAPVFALEHNFPNPFNPTTQITFTVAVRGRTTLEVYDLLGRRVALLFDAAAEPGRRYAVDFNAGHLASGVYLARCTSGGAPLVRKMLLLR